MSDWVQCPTNSIQETLDAKGYRVVWEASAQYCAKSPDERLLYLGYSLSDAWTSCYQDDQKQVIKEDPRPPIVCLCGSTRFREAFQKANLRETLAGNIVLTIGCDMKSDDEMWRDKTPEELALIKTQLDHLHLHKIRLADEVLILNVDGYIGESTQRELEFAIQIGKHVRFWEIKTALPVCDDSGVVDDCYDDEDDDPSYWANDPN